MFEMITASAGLVLATAGAPGMAPIAAIPVTMASTAIATTLAAEMSHKAALPAAAPVDTVVEVQLSRGAFRVRHENGEVEYRPHPVTSMKFGLVGDKFTVCDATGGYLQANDSGRCVLATQSPDIGGAVAVRHVAGAIYELQYAGKTVSGTVHAHQPVTFDMDGVNVGVMLYRLFDAKAVAD